MIPYQRIEYLESTGTQYINTGVIVDINTVVEGRFALTRYFSDNPLFAQDAGSYNNRAFSFTNQASRPGTYVAVVVGDELTFIRENVISYYAFFSILADKEKAIVNGVTFPYSQVPSDFVANYPLYLMAWNRAGNTIIYGEEKCSYFKIAKDNQTIMELYPVRIGQVGYMYDTISSQLLGNAGTGDFVLGPDI